MDKFFGFEFPRKLALRNYPQLPRREGYLDRARALSLYGPELATLLENILFRVGTRAFQACMQERGLRVYRVYTRKLLSKNRSIIRAGNRVCFPERCLGTPHRAPEISRVEICAPVANEPRNTRVFPNSADSSIRNEIVFN